MWAMPLLRWCLVAGGLSWLVVSAESVECPLTSSTISDIQLVQQHGGVVLMQKGTALARIVQPESKESSVPDTLPSNVPDALPSDITAFAAAVVNASRGAVDVYDEMKNVSDVHINAMDPIGGTKHSNFLYKHWSLVVAVAFMLIFVSCIYSFDRSWNMEQKAQEHDSNLAARTESFSLELVRNLVPSAKIDGHQFRGMTRKSSSITLGFEDLSLDIPGHGRVLEGVSGEFKAGRMTIILGPSGAGKTTFMNVLAGKATYGQMSGKIQVNGVETNLADFKSVMGFVPQDDIVHEKLTVREQIHFSAQLRNASGTDAATLHHIVDDVLAVLQIEHIQRSIVGGVAERGISGGQRKRVNIGLEIAAFPTLLFLDEPTSGLDSTSSLALVKSLKKMTQLGITIVVVAHQPRWSLFTLFDDVLILAKGGRTAYMGPSISVCPYFESLGFKKPYDENLADWLMDIVSGCVPNEKDTKYTSSNLPISWETRDTKAGFWPTGSDGESTLGETIRAWTTHDDRAVLAQALQDEWATVDTKRGGSLSISELATVLSNTVGERPSDEVCLFLAAQMAGPGATSVTQEQFINHFVELEKTVRESLKPYDDSTISSRLGSTQELQRQQMLGLPDLHRVMPGCLTQYCIILRRRMVQVRRNNSHRCIDVCLIMVVSLFLGWLNRGQMTFADPFLASKILVFQLGLCLLIAVSCLRTFGRDRLVWWRECSSGLNVFAFFCARMTIDSIDVFLQCVLYTASFYLLAQPETPFRVHFLPCLYLAFAVSGCGYLISACFPAENASLVAILLMLVTNGFLGDPGAAHGYLSLVSMTRWSAQMTYLATADTEGSLLSGGIPPWARLEIAEVVAKQPPDPLDIFKICGFTSSSMVEVGFRRSMANQMFGPWYSASFILVMMAVASRLFAYLGIRYLNRQKYA